jgi:hypothetical protein
MLGPGSRSQVTKKRDFVLAFGVERFTAAISGLFPESALQAAQKL